MSSPITGRTTRVLAVLIAPLLAVALAAPAHAATPRPNGTTVRDGAATRIIAPSPPTVHQQRSLPLSAEATARKRSSKTIAARLTIADQQLTVGQATTFRTRGSKAKRGVKSVVIRFGDGRRRTSTRLSTSATHAYTKPGRYTASVTVRDRKGAKAVVKRIVVVTSTEVSDGALPPKPEDDLFLDSTVVPTADAPASADLRGNAMPVQNQGTIGSCAAWSTAYAMMGWHYAKKFGQQVAFAPMYPYVQTRQGFSSDGTPGGSDPRANLEVMRTQGVATASAFGSGWATDWRSPLTAAQRADAAKYKVSGWQPGFSHSNLAGASAREIEQLKGLLGAGLPVELSIRVRTDFLNYRDGWYNSTVGYTGGLHSMLALGYDANGLYIQNSWGTTWGKAGWFFMSWASVARDVYEASYAQGIAVNGGGQTGTDTVRPTMTGFTQNFAPGYQANASQAPVTFTWAGTDDVGVSSYVLFYRVGARGWTQLPTDASATSATYNPQFGSSYQFAVAAFDAAGNQSDWSITSAFTPANHAEDVASYSAGWSSYGDANFMNGREYEASTANAQMSVRVTGTNVGLVSTRGPRGGRAFVYLDGQYQFAIDTYAASAQYRVVVGWLRFASAGTHTVTVVVEGTQGRPYVGIDSILLS